MHFYLHGTAMADSLKVLNVPAQTTVISSVSPSERTAAAERLAAVCLCTADGNRPCGVCRDCRKIAQRIHPDVIYISRETDSKGNLRKEITVDQIRSMTAEAVIAPNEAVRKVFVIEEADLMNVSAQNAALKLFEEPPNGAVIILCVSSVLRLLETVRSRCAVINLNSDERARTEESSKLSSEYLSIVAAGKELELVEWCYRNENMEGAEADALFDRILSDITDMLCRRRDSGGLDDRELMRLKDLTDRCIEMRKRNAGAKLLFGLLLTCSIDGE